MKEIFASKVMVSFIVVVLGLAYFSSSMDAKMDEDIKADKEIAINI